MRKQIPPTNLVGFELFSEKLSYSLKSSTPLTTMDYIELKVEQCIPHSNVTCKWADNNESNKRNVSVFPAQT